MMTSTFPGKRFKVPVGQILSVPLMATLRKEITVMAFS
jgi:hypothetical protein